MEIYGDVRRFLVVNTTEYNNDGKYGVQDTDFSHLTDLGFNSKEELDAINNLEVGQMIGGIFDFNGVYVMRVA